MDHSLPPIQTPWRTATVVLGGVAAFQFILVIVLLVALLAEPVSQHVTKAAEQKVLAPVAKPKPKPVAMKRTTTAPAGARPLGDDGHRPERQRPPGSRARNGRPRPWEGLRDR